MNLDLTIKNYRCFPQSHPARLAIRKGLTALVGPNNSGKSSLLKFFFEFRNLLAELSSGTLIEALRGRARSFAPQGVDDIAELFSEENEHPIAIQIDLSPALETDPTQLDLVLTHMVIEIPRGQNTYRVRDLRIPTKAIPLDGGYGIEDAGGCVFLTAGTTRVANMTPLLTALQPLARTTYIAAFRNAINIGGNETYFDIRVGEQFLQAWRALKTGAVIKQARAAYRLTEDIQHIFGYDRLDINTANDNKTLRVFVNGRPLRLEELGSGLAQFIVVLANLATREQSYILLDEPELNLHPSLQLDFLTTVASYATEGVLFSTHNIGLARAADQIYALRRIREGVSEMRVYEALPRLAEFLGELSFSGYRELGCQRVLLVEGPTDITTLNQFLRQRGLDHQIACLHVGGGAMINGNRELELAEIQRISPYVDVVIDSERGTESEVLAPERESFRKICTKLGIRCHVLHRRAIENYFSERAIKSVKGEKYRTLGPFERLKDAVPGWAKAENWRIAREMTLDELEDTDLGEFLNSLSR